MCYNDSYSLSRQVLSTLKITLTQGGKQVEKVRYYVPGPIKVKAPEREPGAIPRRTDFKNYLDGHGTVYRFDKDHLPNNLLDAKFKDHLIMILYNIHTDQLDEVAFELESQSEINEDFVWIRGFIDDIDDCFQIKIEYDVKEPLKSYILVYASARPDYRYFERL